MRAGMRHAAATAARAAEVAEGGGAAALGVLVRVAKLEAALREEQAKAAQARTQACTHVRVRITECCAAGVVAFALPAGARGWDMRVKRQA
jgi:hypothetical protein